MCLLSQSDSWVILTFCMAVCCSHLACTTFTLINSLTLVYYQMFMHSKPCPLSAHTVLFIVFLHCSIRSRVMLHIAVVKSPTGKHTYCKWISFKISIDSYPNAEKLIKQCVNKCFFFGTSMFPRGWILIILVIVSSSATMRMLFVVLE